MFCAVVGALASAVFALLARSHTMCCPTTNNYYSKFPTRAADPQGASKHLPTLEDEYKRYRLEEAIDSTLEELSKKKESKSK